MDKKVKLKGSRVRVVAARVLSIQVSLRPKIIRTSGTILSDSLSFIEEKPCSEILTGNVIGGGAPSEALGRIGGGGGRRWRKRKRRRRKRERKRRRGRKKRRRRGRGGDAAKRGEDWKERKMERRARRWKRRRKGTS